MKKLKHVSLSALSPTHGWKKNKGIYPGISTEMSLKSLYRYQWVRNRFLAKYRNINFSNFVLLSPITLVSSLL